MSLLDIPLHSLLYVMHTTDKDLDTISDLLWARNSTNIGKIMGAEPIKVQYDPTKPIPKLAQYPLKPNKELKSVVEGIVYKGLRIPRISACCS